MTNQANGPALAEEAAKRKTEWLRVQALAQQWRETGDPLVKGEAAELLVKLMAADALIKIKAMEVDFKLPARLRRDYRELAADVVASVLANPGTRATAILENHNPEKALISTMVNFYLRNKIVDHLRDQPVKGIFRTVARSAKAKPGAPAPGALATSTDADATPDAPIDDTPGTALLTDPQETPHAPRYQPSSMLADDGPGAAPLPQGDSAWDTEHELVHDLTKLLEPPEKEAIWYDLAGYTADEAASAIGVHESTYKRRLSLARAKFAAYHASGD